MCFDGEYTNIPFPLFRYLDIKFTYSYSMCPFGLHKITSLPDIEALKKIASLKNSFNDFLHSRSNLNKNDI